MFGKLIEYGPAPYDFNEKEEDSFYVKLQNKGKERIIWSLGLADAIKESHVVPGDIVKFTFLSKEEFVLEDGEKRHRSTFSVKKIDKPRKAASKSTSPLTHHSDETQDFSINQKTSKTKSSIESVHKTFDFILKTIFGLIICAWIYHAFT